MKWKLKRERERLKGEWIDGGAENEKKTVENDEMFWKDVNRMRKDNLIRTEECEWGLVERKCNAHKRNWALHRFTECWKSNDDCICGNDCIINDWWCRSVSSIERKEVRKSVRIRIWSSLFELTLFDSGKNGNATQLLYHFENKYSARNLRLACKDLC